MHDTKEDGTCLPLNESARNSALGRSRSILRDCYDQAATAGGSSIIDPSKRASYSARLGHLAQVLRVVITAILAVACVSLFNGIFRSSYYHAPQHYRDLDGLIYASSTPGRGNINNEKVFIAANIIDEDLIRGAWGRSLVKLIDLLGPANVFVSIYENDSGNGTSLALRDLQTQFHCRSSVVTGEHVPLDSFPPVKLRNGEEHVQRITYLAEIRNRLLRPLDERYKDDSQGFSSAANITFDKVLFLNDVYFSPREAIHLLFATNQQDGKARYRAACAVDFIRGAQFYDTFVVRDAEGYGNGFMVYPWFSTAGQGISRAAVLHGSDAVPVRSCWGGLAAFEAALFQTRDAASPLSKTRDYELLQFRSSGELYWEAAECCLLFADTEEQYGQPDSEEGTGVFMNPFVRVAYTETTWNLLPFFRRFERVFEIVQYVLSWMAYPEYNPRRLHEPGDLVNQSIWEAGNGTASTPSGFATVERVAQPGGFCGQRRLFVMLDDIESANAAHAGKNWRSIPLP